MRSTASFALLTPRRFRIALALVLGTAFLLLQLAPRIAAPPADLPPLAAGWAAACLLPSAMPHCHEAIAFLNTQPGIAFDLHDVSTPAGEALLRVMADEFNLPEEDLGVPLFVRGSRYLIGFDAPETTGRELLALAGGESGVTQSGAEASRIRLPLLGEIDSAHHSLLALTMLMGLSPMGSTPAPCGFWST